MFIALLIYMHILYNCTYIVFAVDLNQCC